MGLNIERRPDEHLGDLDTEVHPPRLGINEILGDMVLGLNAHRSCSDQRPQLLLPVDKPNDRYSQYLTFGEALIKTAAESGCGLVELVHRLQSSLAVKDPLEYARVSSRSGGIAELIQEFAIVTALVTSEDLNSSLFGSIPAWEDHLSNALARLNPLTDEKPQNIIDSLFGSIPAWEDHLSNAPAQLNPLTDEKPQNIIDSFIDSRVLLSAQIASDRPIYEHNFARQVNVVTLNLAGGNTGFGVRVLAADDNRATVFQSELHQIARADKHVEKVPNPINSAIVIDRHLCPSDHLRGAIADRTDKFDAAVAYAYTNKSSRELSGGDFKNWYRRIDDSFITYMDMGEENEVPEAVATALSAYKKLNGDFHDANSSISTTETVLSISGVTIDQKELVEGLILKNFSSFCLNADRIILNGHFTIRLDSNCTVELDAAEEGDGYTSAVIYRDLLGKPRVDIHKYYSNRMELGDPMSPERIILPADSLKGPLDGPTQADINKILLLINGESFNINILLDGVNEEQKTHKLISSYGISAETATLLLERPIYYHGRCLTEPEMSFHIDLANQIASGHPTMFFGGGVYALLGIDMNGSGSAWGSWVKLRDPNQRAIAVQCQYEKFIPIASLVGLEKTPFYDADPEVLRKTLHAVSKLGFHVRYALDSKDANPESTALYDHLNKHFPISRRDDGAAVVQYFTYGGITGEVFELVTSILEDMGIPKEALIYATSLNISGAPDIILGDTFEEHLMASLAGTMKIFSMGEHAPRVFGSFPIINLTNPNDIHIIRAGGIDQRFIEALLNGKIPLRDPALMAQDGSAILQTETESKIITQFGLGVLTPIRKYLSYNEIKLRGLTELDKYKIAIDAYVDGQIRYMRDYIQINKSLMSPDQKIRIETAMGQMQTDLSSFTTNS